MSLSKEDIRHVAHLARLALSEQELERYTSQLAQILDYAATLDELETAGVEPAPYPYPMVLPQRADQPGPTLPQERVLALAPDREGESFRVPRVLGDEG